MNLFLSIHQFHLKIQFKISQNREKWNKRKRQKRKLNSTYAHWNERQTCLKTNSVNYTRSSVQIRLNDVIVANRSERRLLNTERSGALRRGQTKRKQEPRGYRARCQAFESPAPRAHTKRPTLEARGVTLVLVRSAPMGNDARDKAPR